uniref:transposase domain-containing protein n=1 Tax=Salmonella sp. SAL04162 TaxID=3159782 RepID=UPI00397B8F27
YFRPERELAGSDFHRRKDRALQGTHNNVCERTIKTVVMGRKSWLFAGSLMAGERAARIMSLLETAKLNGLEPHAWLTDVLNRLPSWPEDRLEELLPLPGFIFSA